jgi:2'-5' RNA ligase
VTEGRAARRNGESARVFFGLWPPAPLAGHLAGLAEQWAAAAGGRATRRNTIHLTLAFLGNVPVGRLAELQAVAAGVCSEPCELVLDTAGIWHRKRIAWAGCTKVPPALAALAAGLAGRLSAAGFPLADAGRPFVPHVTLVRRVRDTAAAPPPLGPLRWYCDRFVLVRSRLSPDGADYEHLAGFSAGEAGP